jgi:hypothetical protein
MVRLILLVVAPLVLMAALVVLEAVRLHGILVSLPQVALVFLGKEMLVAILLMLSGTVLEVAVAQGLLALMD